MWQSLGDMKTFAIYQPNSETPTFVKGVSATIKFKRGKSKVVVTKSDKTKETFENVLIFTEVSESVKVL